MSKKILIVSKKIYHFENEGDFEYRITSNYNDMYRIFEDVILIDGQQLEEISKEYWIKAAVILDKGESALEYIKKGITQFIYDITDKRQIEAVVEIISSSYRRIKPNGQWGNGVCFFDFDRRRYEYKGEEIYLTEKEEQNTFDYINRNIQPQNKYVIYYMRKKFGKDFLR